MISPVGNTVLQNALTDFERASEKVAQALGPPVEDQIELSQAYVDLMLAQRRVEAALRLVKVADRNLGETLKLQE